MQLLRKHGIIIISGVFKMKAAFHINNFTKTVVPGLGSTLVEVLLKITICVVGRRCSSILCLA